MRRRMLRNSTESRGIGVERLDHQRDDEAPVVRHGGVEEAGVDDPAEVRERHRSPGATSAEHLLLEAPDAVLHGLEEQLFLVTEVVVDRALGDAGRARDAVDRGALVAEAREAIDRALISCLRDGSPCPARARLAGDILNVQYLPVTRPVNGLVGRLSGCRGSPLFRRLPYGVPANPSSVAIASDVVSLPGRSGGKDSSRLRFGRDPLSRLPVMPRSLRSVQENRRHRGGSGRPLHLLVPRRRRGLFTDGVRK